MARDTVYPKPLAGPEKFSQGEPEERYEHCVEKRYVDRLGH